MTISVHQAPSPVHPIRPGKRMSTWRVLRRALTVALSLALILSLGWLLTHRDRVVDQFAVWNFHASSSIEKYADRSTMTGEGRFLFFASRPAISTGSGFDKACAGRKEGVGILGCYLSADRSIHLFDVTDVRLDGIEEVVASHEMLHAAWDRMSGDERATLAPLLEAEVAKRSDDAALTATLAFYATTEPGERLNELHSILGTEFAELGAPLEAHYSLYFRDRAALVALHDASNAVFVAQAKQVTDISNQMNELVSGINADYAAYNSGYDILNADIVTFNDQARSGSFDSVASFEAARGRLFDRQTVLNDLYASISARSAQYDTLRAQLDALNVQGDQLNESINIQPRSGGL